MVATPGLAADTPVMEAPASSELDALCANDPWQRKPLPWQPAGNAKRHAVAEMRLRNAVLRKVLDAQHISGNVGAKVAKDATQQVLVGPSACHQELELEDQAPTIADVSEVAQDASQEQGLVEPSVCDEEELEFEDQVPTVSEISEVAQDTTQEQASVEPSACGDEEQESEDQAPVCSGIPGKKEKTTRNAKAKRVRRRIRRQLEQKAFVDACREADAMLAKSLGNSDLGDQPLGCNSSSLASSPRESDLSAQNPGAEEEQPEERRRSTATEREKENKRRRDRFQQCRTTTLRSSCEMRGLASWGSRPVLITRLLACEDLSGNSEEPSEFSVDEFSEETGD